MGSETPQTTVTILGSGTCVPSLQRSSCAALLETGKHCILIDSGPGTMHRLLLAGVDIQRIDFIFYTHFHPDHSGELVPFIFASKYPSNNRRKTPLTVLAGKGFFDFFERLKAAYGQWIVLPPGLMHLGELDNRRKISRSFDGFQVQSCPVVHNPESIALRITDSEGISVVFSGDTDFSADLIDLAAGAHLLICESALPDEMKVDGHLTPALAGKIASQANVGKLVLTHFYPECDRTDIRAQCRKTYSGPLILAEDLMRIIP